MIYYNDKRLCVGQIKQLLHGFNLPQCKVYKEGMEFEEGDTYIKDGFLYSVTRKIKRDELGNPIIDNFTKQYIYESDELVHNRLRAYKFGDKLENLTKTLDLRNNYYDTHTHHYLGDYLRFIRDYTGVNLMSLYNCFSYEVPSNFAVDIKLHVPYVETVIGDEYIMLGSDSTVDNSDFSISAGDDAVIDESNNTLEFVSTGKAETIINLNFNSSSEDYTIYCLPVRFGNAYTIAIDCHSSIEIFCGFYDNSNYITCPSYEADVLETATYMKSSTNNFRHPFLYDRLLNVKPCYSYEKNLRMFIKVPAKCESSIVVLEGDYIKETDTYISNNKQVLCNDTLTYIGNDKFNNREFLSKKQLLNYSTKGKFLLADRLVEYLTHQVITPIDDVGNNIKRAQKRIVELSAEGVGTVKGLDGESYSYSLGIPFDFYGIWDEKTRDALYDFARVSNFRSDYTDLLYYVDKDMEYKMGGLPINIGIVDWTTKKGE